MSINEEQGGSGHPRAALEVESPVVGRPPQQHPRMPIIFSPERPTYSRPLVRCFLMSCILLWAAISIAGISVLIVFGVYQPKKPVLSLSTASLNAGYVDEHTVSGGPGSGLALNVDLAVLAVITSNNTKIDVELHDMHLDLYFKGHLVGTQAVPAPGRERPHDHVLRSVHFVTGEVPLPQEDAEAWRNATANGGPVVLHLAGRFRTRLFIGPWVRFPLKVYPHCTLWLKPPPGGTLLESRCRE